MGFLHTKIPISGKPISGKPWNGKFWYILLPFVFYGCLVFLWLFGIFMAIWYLYIL
jgi:hypothetical protein